MGQFKDMQIKTVIEHLNQSYFLPDIQREYVWLSNPKEKKIEELFDSILRGYPIGSFLFWKIKKNDIETTKDAEQDSTKLNFQLYKFIENYDQRKPHNEKVNIEQISFDDLSIVLDGQQRLTSLYIGLKGTRTIKRRYARKWNPNAFEEKHLFLNLRYSPNEEIPDDNYKFEFHTKDKIPEIDEKNYWFKVGKILELDSLINYAMEKNLSHGEAKILEKLGKAFCSDNLISYFEETEKNLDKVLRIFIRVNSAGTVLSYSDLLMSILTANFSTNIRDLMNDFIDSVSEKGFGVMKRDHVLKTCLLLTDSNHIFQLRNFSKKNINKIENNWEKITDAIFQSTELLKEFGYANRLSSGYILSVVAHYLFKSENITEEDKTELLKFVRIAQIKSYFSVSLDSRLEIVAKTLRGSKNFVEVNEKLSKELPLKISDNDIEEILDSEYGDASILPVLQLLYPNLDYRNSIFHIDHIYPLSKFNVKNKKLPVEYQNKHRGNSLYNLQLLEDDENLSKKDKDPEIWLSKHCSSDKNKINAYKERNYIDQNLLLDWENIATFEEKRRSEIKRKLSGIFQVSP